MPPAVEARSPTRYSARFWVFLTATSISGLGDGLAYVAFPLLAAEATDDARLVSLISAAYWLPWLLVSLPAGAIADRRDRRMLLCVVEAFRATVLAALAVLISLDRSPLSLLTVAMFSIGTAETVFSAANYATLPALVPQERLARANGLLVAVETATVNMIGPGVGGLAFAVAAALPFVADSASYALSGALLFMAVPRQTRAAPAKAHIRDDVRAGFDYFRRQPDLRALALVLSSLALTQAAVFAVLVLFARQVLGLSAVGYGMLLAVVAIGNVIGGLVAGPLDERFGTRTLIPIAAVLATAAYLVAGLAQSAVVLGAALWAEAVAVAIGNVSSLAYRQRMVPNELLGRVGNIFRFFIFGAVPVGAVAGGLLAYSLGLRAPFLVAAAVQLVATIVLCPVLVRRLTVPMDGEGAMQPS